MSQPDPPTELISLPAPSWYPVLTAAGLAFVLIGIYAWFPIGIGGAILALLALVGWLGTTRREIAARPQRQATDTAPVPLSAADPRI